MSSPETIVSCFLHDYSSYTWKASRSPCSASNIRHMFFFPVPLLFWLHCPELALISVLSKMQCPELHWIAFNIQWSDHRIDNKNSSGSWHYTFENADYVHYCSLPTIVMPLIFSTQNYRFIFISLELFLAIVLACQDCLEFWYCLLDSF